MRKPNEKTVVHKHRVLSREEENDLATRLQAAEGAERDGLRDQLLKANMGFVYQQAMRLAAQCGIPQHLVEDAVQESLEGVWETSTEGFDPERGNRFTTYCMWQIRHALSRRMVPVRYAVIPPTYMLNASMVVGRITKELAANLGRPPTDDEIAEKYADNLSALAHPPNEPLATARRYLERVRNLHAYSPSLDQPVGGDDTDALGDLIEDTSHDTEHAKDGWKFASARIKDALATLTEREQRVIRERFLRKDGESLSLEEVGKIFGITRERVRQLQEQALQKMLRHLGPHKDELRTLLK